MNYSEISDFEINKAVGMATGDATVSEPVFNQVIRNSNGKQFDPCNSWADAGPIILENRIGLEPAIKGARWVAQNGYFKTAEAHVNPLRAAMIVFLMMQEQGE